jgi:hypothetical protein
LKIFEKETKGKDRRGTCCFLFEFSENAKITKEGSANVVIDLGRGIYHE